MQHLAMIDALNQFTHTLLGRDLPIRCVHLAGSLARHEADEESDVDVVVVTSNLPLAQLRAVAATAAEGATLAQDVLTESGSKAVFSVPKVVREQDWATNQWYSPMEFGFLFRSSPILYGEDLCRRVRLPGGQVLLHDALATFALRTARCLQKLAIPFLKRQTGPYRFRISLPVKFLRLAIWSECGTYVRSSTSVLSVAGKVFGGPCAELASQAFADGRDRFLLSAETTLALGEQMIALYRRCVGRAKARMRSSGPLPFPFPITPDFCPVIKKADVHIPGANTSLYTAFDSIEGLCVLTPESDGAWTRTIRAMPPLLPGPYSRVFVLPADMYRDYLRYESPVELWALAAASPSDLVHELGLSPDRESVIWGALRSYSYFRYNALNKWVDFMQSPAPPSATSLSRRVRLHGWSLLGLRQALDLPVSGVLDAVETQLTALKEPEGVERFLDGWLAFVDQTPPVPSLLASYPQAVLDA